MCAGRCGTRSAFGTTRCGCAGGVDLGEEWVVSEAKKNERELPAGIVIHAVPEAERKPMISAFIWGGKVRPEPTLPFGRWKSTAA